MHNGAACSYLSNMYSRFRILPSANSFSAGLSLSAFLRTQKKSWYKHLHFYFVSNSDLLYIFFILEAISIILCKVSSLSRIINYFWLSYFCFEILEGNDNMDAFGFMTSLNFVSVWRIIFQLLFILILQKHLICIPVDVLGILGFEKLKENTFIPLTDYPSYYMPLA